MTQGTRGTRRTKGPVTSARTSAWRELTGYHKLVLFVAWLGWVFDIMDTALFNFAKVPMMTELLGAERYKLVGPAIEGQIQTWFLVGWAVGGLVFGILADRWGRTRTLVLTILLYCALTGLTALCQTWEQVAVLRFLTALGIGGEWAAGAALVAEVLPNRARPLGAAVLQSAAALGPILAATVNLGLANESWRWLFVVGVLPALITVLIRRRVREPESWERADRTGSVLEPLRGLLADPRLARYLLAATLLGVVGVAGAQNVSFWLPNLVNAVSGGVAEAEVKARTSYATYSLHVGTILGVLVFPWLCERLGRRPALLGFFVLSPIAVHAATTGGGTFERLLLVAPLMSLFSIGLTAGFALYFPELFPTRYRATGAGFAYNVGRILAAPYTWVTGMVIGGAGGVAQGVAAAGLIYVLGIVALALAPETRGKPLEA